MFGRSETDIYIVQQDIINYEGRSDQAYIPSSLYFVFWDKYRQLE